MGPRRRALGARPRPPRALTAALLAALLPLGLTAGCGGTAGDVVTRSGASFEVAGEPFRFVGFNLYDAAASDLYSCSPSTRLSQNDLVDLLREAHDRAGATVLRFWAYQTYTDGGRDWTGVDRVVAAARKVGMRVVPVLEDGPGNCSTGQEGVSKASYPDDRWFTDGYRRPYGSARLSYRDYVRVVAERYRDEPAVLGWMMMNEAETQRRDADGRPVLADFARDVSAVIKAADPNHLVTLGTQSNGAPGASGQDFATVYSEPGLDFAEVHDWARYGADDEAVPGSDSGRLPDAGSPACTDPAAKIACSFAFAPGLGKPLVVGEVGITATDAASRRRRADLIGAKARAAFSAGADGYLVWHLNSGPTDGYDVEPALDDPLLATLRSVARGLSG